MGDAAYGGSWSGPLALDSATDSVHASVHSGVAVSNTPPRIVDLFCGAGGAAKGYHQAGFEVVVGVDKKRQPNYPYEFHKRDALEALADADFMAGFDAAHGSPTCQRFCRVTAWRGSRSSHPDLLTPTLNLLRPMSIPWVVENAPEAAWYGPLRMHAQLCGTQFGLRIKRHRAFEMGNWSCFDFMQPCRCHRNPELIPFEHKDERAFADAMGCTWMNKLEARQAIPPAFTEWIGRPLIQHLDRDLVGAVTRPYPPGGDQQ